MRTESDNTIYLKDYQPSPYRIVAVDMEVKIAAERCRVRTLLTIEPRDGTPAGTALVLDGDELKLETVAIDGAPLVQSAYVATASALTIVEVPLRRFVLDTEVTIEPELNTKLMGLYRSNGTWCTQCEPEGFRRITYFLDRPDNLATFRVKMIADRALAPILLANGNPVEAGDLGNGQHYAVWDDPHPKPAYLFAMVAGDLGLIEDQFTTASGKPVKLGIYATHGKQDECLWAMDSLKRSMAWDERRFGREYDLDVFNIVAVSDFNFGAMENKGLNIFNDKLVFARPETATDGDFESVERVIAHEYFHIWTGNRITCRDWFQLCLKEGLTVFRDQEFTSDERSRPVKRIDDVRTLRAAQFPEDGGPLAHPPRPDHYSEINNFYTATVYEKGAEIVRMLATLLGEAGFRKGMDLYFERHDGDATTIEAFLKVFEDANGVDLTQFKTWYLQAGTPAVSVSDSYDEASKTYRLTLTQTVDPTPGEPTKLPLVMPVKFALVGPNGSEMGWSGVSGGTVRDDMIILDAPSATLTFTGVANRPVPSLFRGFSAPVKLTTPLPEADQLFLARHDSDPFNRWQSLQDVAMGMMIAAVGGKAWAASAVDALAAALADTATSETLDPAYKALALVLPTESNIARAIDKDVDPARIHAVRRELISAVIARVGADLLQVFHANAVSSAFAPTADQAGKRALRNIILALLVLGKAPGAAGLAAAQYAEASNMTDRFAALAAMVSGWTSDAERLMADFRQRFAGDPLVFDKWLALTASAADDSTVDRIRAVLAEPDFPLNNPNRLRSLVGTFAMGNPVQFARPDGSGFRFVTDFVADIDARNPQVAARLLTGFRVWQSFEPNRRSAARQALESLRQRDGLSRNASEILNRMLESTAG
ncbi:MAG: pepN [Devosia sp.]|nr:pepN [Devosia sp.]